MANRGTKDTRTYPAIFSKDEAGVAVEFPDLPGCFTCGKSESEAVARAEEALEGFLYVSERDGDHVPAPIPFEKIQLKKGEAIVLITVHMGIVPPPSGDKKTAWEYSQGNFFK